MINYNQELIKKGALDKETELIIKKNAEIISIVNSFIPYENYNIFQELLGGYEKLINKYSKYAYLLGFTRAVYEKD